MAGWIQPIDANTRVLIRHQGRPITTYAVMLQVRRHRKWQTIMLVDNAHGHHHMHRFVGTTKLEGVPFAQGSTVEVIPEAIGYMLKSWRPIIEGWESR
jgi:UDP-N-acetylmuramyl pentapeptide phosphotransferase/UDP-N-acetylglucosamine-1-phosphate transferase